MNSAKILGIIEELKSLTLLEASELVKNIETTFNVDASQVVASGSVLLSETGDSQSSASNIEEKTEFDVILTDVPSTKKIAILKVVRSITGLGLKEAKDLVESVPKLLRSGVSDDDAQQVKIRLEEEGAQVTIQ